jgi:hypothetical protein
MTTTDPFAGIGQAIGNTVQHWQAWQRLPLVEKSAIRAGRGAWVLAFLAYLLVETRGGAATPLLAAPAAFGVLWLAAGVHGARGARDVVQGVWWGIGTACCAALLVYEVYPADWGPVGVFWLRGVYLASLATAVMRCWLTLRPMPGVKLPHPSKVPGLPIAGPATAAAAHAAILRRSSRPWWKFW